MRESFNDSVGQPMEFAAQLQTEAGDFWPLLRQAATHQDFLDGMMLVRWDRLSTVPMEDFGPNPEEFVAGILKGIEAHLSPSGACFRYDGSSFLVVDPDGTYFGVGQSVARIVEAITGLVQPRSGFSPRDLVEVWSATGIGNLGMIFARRFRADEGEEEAGDLSGRRSFAGRPRSDKLVLGDAEFAFFPIWDVSANHVTTYLCRPSWIGAGGAKLSECSREVVRAPADHLARVDTSIFTAAVEFVQNALDNFGAANVVIPVHWRVFSTPSSTAAYLKTVDTAIWPVLENISFEVIAQGHDSIEAVAATCGILEKYGCGIWLRVDPEFDSFEPFSRGGLLAAGYGLPELGDESAIAEMMRNFVQRVATQGVLPYVIGLSETTETVAAVNAGMAMIGSDAIALPLCNDSADDPGQDPASVLRMILASKQV